MQIGLYTSFMTDTGLRDGRSVSVRPLREDDGERLRRLFFRLSPLSVYRRFMSPLPAPSEDGLRRLLDVDHSEREALAALDGDEIVAVARYVRRPAPGSGAAEIAVVVADDWQRDGLGHLLLERLSGLARVRGIEHFQATVLGDNAPAMHLVRSLFPTSHARWETGVAEFEIPLSQADSSSP
jgi:GNAT superfamily N-acetyltransferase